MAPRTDVQGRVTGKEIDMEKNTVDMNHHKAFLKELDFFENLTPPTGFGCSCPKPTKLKKSVEPPYDEAAATAHHEEFLNELESL